MTRNPSKALLALALTAVFALCAALPAAAAAIDTHFALLAGHGGAAQGENGAVVVPGTVIPIEAGPAAAGDAEYPQRIANLAGKLRRTLSLGEVNVVYTFPTRSEVGEETELPPPSATSTVRVHVKLRGYNEKLATYEVRFRDGSKVFADSVVSVERGKQAVVGGLDGDEAPYLFLVVSPAAGHGGPRLVEGDVVPPRRLYGPAPQYTPEARKARVQGVVIVRAVIGADGEVREVEVLKGLPLGLSEAAVEAIRAWSFEAARDGDGNPLEVYYNLTINFRLDDENSEDVRTSKADQH